MAIEFNHWPEDLARHYRARGYWVDLPLGDILDRHQHSDAVALIDGERQYRYRELHQAVNRLAGAFQRRGLTTGDTALVQLGNNAELCITLFALLRIGVAPVNALFSHQRTELDAYAGQIEPVLLVADRQHALFRDDHYITALQSRLPGLATVALLNDGGERDLSGWIDEPQQTPVNGASQPGEVAFFQLSGGSTGTPKLIPRTHNDYYYSIRRSVEICGFNAATRFLCAIPAAHNYAMSSPGWLGVFYGGGTLVLAADPSPTRCFPIIEQQQITHTALVPPAVSLWLQALRDGVQANLSTLTLLQVGGARLSEALARRIPAEIGCQLQQVFGMAEGLVNYTRLDDSDEVIFTTQGRPMCPDDEVRVVDEDGNILPPGTEGRLMTRGPYTFRGYYRSPEHNARAFDREGFYGSGDLIVVGEDGNIRVVGREKDQINRGGEKIAAEEVENLLLRHEAILHAALVSMEDELMGEKSCAFIVGHRPLRAVEIRRYLRELGVAEFKLPDRVEMVPDLPLTAVGKVDKKRLRQIIADHQLAR
ncbi:(2,3-dihydroxybenzoyl)adenylate synthase [Shimwellia pseudoproteus]|uniref:(2,3-dihydroxybenzoyl)adenylate synthase n=1 Tax=Shimwellia pseudoproteus TaxID=570012 RepID=UPI0018EA68FE|nr:(2,3-dihydroxybenzoyl)adenylate synthase [Shimwellia pseudoproteus]MBJ3815399.1 (2,3-dihydroxybenzoyl)adenylate synthase [Shimwellia pseudoproteus]